MWLLSTWGQESWEKWYVHTKTKYNVAENHK